MSSRDGSQCPKVVGSVPSQVWLSKNWKWKASLLEVKPSTYRWRELESRKKSIKKYGTGRGVLALGFQDTGLMCRNHPYLNISADSSKVKRGWQLCLLCSPRKKIGANATKNTPPPCSVYSGSKLRETKEGLKKWRHFSLTAWGT